MFCLVSLRTGRPLIHRFARAYLGGSREHEGSVWEARWLEMAGFRAYFRTVTIGWEAGYLVEAAIRLAAVHTASTGSRSP
ncbi:MAG: hypothetical protein DLM57_04770 [Pseudonocardiales bacterium]|nr:MAG: hypothetical protein DLM57_04770 [Pseudonocardiales bacterium]